MNVTKRCRSTLALLCALGVFHAVSANASAPSGQLRLIGTAIFQGDASALVEDLSTGEQSFVSVNDSIQGCTVQEILPGKLRLNSGTTSFELASASLPPSAAQTPTVQGAVMIKQAPKPALKSTLSKVRSVSKSSKPTFSMPISGARFVSGFGRRKDPWGGSTKTHHGVDLAAAHGTRIRAAADGTVKVVASNGLLGRHIIIDHGNGYETVYAHLFRQSVRNGQDVSRGQLIGYEGSTGRSTGPHLHFEIRKHGQYVDPCDYLPELDK